MMGLPPKLASLIAADVPELGPGPRGGVYSIREVERGVEAIVKGADATNRDLALGTVLLWHDHLDAAHDIAQRIETRDGSYLHAIMHRREPDYSNAKYWFRRVGTHSCYAVLAEHVKSVQPELASQLAPRGEWDPFAFVDACESAARTSPGGATELLREIQATELRTFLGYLIPTHDIADE